MAGVVATFSELFRVGARIETTSRGSRIAVTPLTFVREGCHVPVPRAQTAKRHGHLDSKVLLPQRS